MEEQPKLLYVEDDQNLAFVTKDHLEEAGYDITHCENGLEAFESFKTNKFDLCVVDVMLPILDGFTLAKKIRKMNEAVPILFLTAKSLEEDKIEGLQIGGDDYITKPFSMEELKLKIEVFLKRSSIAPKPEEPFEFNIGEYYFNHKNLKLAREADEKILTQREADVLLELVKEKGNVVKKSDILTRLWGDDDYFVGRSLDVFISRLRKYMKDDPNIRIDNLHGVGFKLMDTAPVSS